MRCTIHGSGQRRFPELGLLPITKKQPVRKGTRVSPCSDPRKRPSAALVGPPTGRGANWVLAPELSVDGSASPAPPAWWAEPADGGASSFCGS